MNSPHYEPGSRVAEASPAPFLAVWLVGVIGLSATLLVQAPARVGVQARARHGFQRAVQMTGRTIELYFRHYINLLKERRGLLAAGRLPPHARMLSYLESIEIRQPSMHSGLQDIDIAWRVKPEERKVHDFFIRRQGFPASNPIFGKGEAHPRGGQPAFSGLICPHSAAERANPAQPRTLGPHPPSLLASIVKAPTISAWKNLR